MVMSEQQNITDVRLEFIRAALERHEKLFNEQLQISKDLLRLSQSQQSMDRRLTKIESFNDRIAMFIVLAVLSAALSYVVVPRISEKRTTQIRRLENDLITFVSSHNQITVLGKIPLWPERRTFQ